MTTRGHTRICQRHEKGDRRLTRGQQMALKPIMTSKRKKLDLIVLMNQKRPFIQEH